MHALIDKVIDSLGLGKAHFHLGGMDVDVRFHRGKRQVQDRKGKAVLHEVGPVSGFQRLGEDIAPEHPAVDKEDFEIAGGPRYIGTPDEALQAVLALLCPDGQHFFADLPPVDAIDQFLQVAVSGRMELLLSVHAVVE